MDNYTFENSLRYPFQQEPIEKDVKHDVKDRVKQISKSNRYIYSFFEKHFKFIPQNYIKYFIMLFLHTLAIIIFTIIYYLMMFDFDKYYFIPDGFKREHFYEHPLLVSFFMSIQFQTTTAYVDLKLKSFFARAIVNLQVIMTFVITFLILFE